MGFNLRRGLIGLGESAAEVGKDWFGTEVRKNAAIDLEGVRAKIQEERDARLSELVEGRAIRSEDRGIINARLMEESTREGKIKTAKETAQAAIDINTDPSNVQKAIEKLNAMAPAEAKVKRDAMIADLEAKATPEALRAANQIARATHIESAASLAQAILAGKQAEIADLSIADKKRANALSEEYLKETDSAKKDAIADALYTLAGKDRFQPVVGKDDQGNPKFVGGFNTRTGKLDTGAGALQPDDRDIATLRKRPGDAKAFNLKFGAGAAESILNPAAGGAGDTPASRAKPAPAEKQRQGIIDAAISGPTLTAEPNSPAARVQARNVAAREDAAKREAARERSEVEFQSKFDMDSASMTPQELYDAYGNQLGLLTPQQRIVYQRRIKQAK